MKNLFLLKNINYFFSFGKDSFYNFYKTYYKKNNFIFFNYHNNNFKNIKFIKLFKIKIFFLKIKKFS
ncbi:hypothetical protein K5B08_01140, partial [Candidatus Carsonella ruddii]|nr:hypothetical protein [Candidatus Carsonella ruddii]